MSNSIIFSAMENVLSQLEQQMEYAKQEIEIDEEQIREMPEDADSWTARNRRETLKRDEIKLQLYEEAYNYIYMNFQKIVKNI